MFEIYVGENLGCYIVVSERKMNGRNDAFIATTLQAVFRGEFLRKYLPKVVRGKTEIEFLEQKKGNLSVTEYAAIFVELTKFCPHYSEATTESSKCLKVENGLRLEIKQAIGYQQIRRFPELVNNYRIYEDNSKARSAHYKGLSERRGKNNMSCGKPCSALVDKGKWSAAASKRPSGGGSPTPLNCYRCGEIGSSCQLMQE
ncbi:uncharacterized protein LOC127131971 [Lathyrus oleraceus]|uniref:uncharacterized protein LOC127131971 n=1 Tax=Pisum sativum TaxID=3888 RepID=UPI0021CF9AF8|nr:uncharacterized protein LOC127131971 [Pisum sativum]